MSVAVDIYYPCPGDPLKERQIDVEMVRVGGRLDFREEPVTEGLFEAVCLTYDFSNYEDAELAAKVARSLGTHVEGPRDYWAGQ